MWTSLQLAFWGSLVRCFLIIFTVICPISFPTIVSGYEELPDKIICQADSLVMVPKLTTPNMIGSGSSSKYEPARLIRPVGTQWLVEYASNPMLCKDTKTTIMYENAFCAGCKANCYHDSSVIKTVCSQPIQECPVCDGSPGKVPSFEPGEGRSSRVGVRNRVIGGTHLVQFHNIFITV